MPVAVFAPGTQAASGDFGPFRELIPGVTPGGQFAGKDKPAMLLKDAWIQVINWTQPNASGDFTHLWFLKLSQQQDGSPGFRIPVGQIGWSIAEGDGTGRHSAAFVINDLFRAHGTVWAPRKVGAVVSVQSSLSMQVQLFVSYELIFIPWRDWFVHWEFLDNVTDNSQEF